MKRRKARFTDFLKNHFRIADVHLSDMPKINDIVKNNNFFNVEPLVEELGIKVKGIDKPLLLHRQAFKGIVLPAAQQPNDYVRQHHVTKALTELYPTAQLKLGRQITAKLQINIHYSQKPRVCQVDLDMGLRDTIIISNLRETNVIHMPQILPNPKRGLVAA